MTVIIKKNSSKKVLADSLLNLEPQKKFDAFKYCGTSKITENPIQIQKKLRNEWD